MSELLEPGVIKEPVDEELLREGYEEMARKADVCSECRGEGEVFKRTVRMMGYTLAEGETEANTIDEHYEVCSSCNGTWLGGVKERKSKA